MASSELIAAAPVSSPVPGSDAPKTSDRSYRPDIDGLRAIAIVSVILYHAGVPVVAGGFTGVDIFFAISGYLIGGHIFSEMRGGTFSFLRFYQHRAKRILPAYFFIIFFVLAVALFLLSPYETQYLGRAAFASTLSVSNILFWKTSGYFDPKSELNPLLMTWSLGVEEQFYLLVPLLMVWIRKFRQDLLLPAIAAISAVSLAYAMHALGTEPGKVFYTLAPRAWELGLGVLLAIAQQKWRFLPVRAYVSESAGAVGLGLILAPMFLLTVATPFPGAAALPSVLGAVVLLANSESCVNRKILSLSVLAFCGRISYSLYLWHWPLLALARSVYGTRLPPRITAGIVAISSVLAILSYWFIEQPFRKSKLQPVPLLKRYGFAMVCILAICGVVWRTQGLPARNPELARLEDSGVVLHTDPCLSQYGSDSPHFEPFCLPVPGGPPSIAVWGDSHAGALVPAIRTIAKDAGMGFGDFTKVSCPPLTGATRYLPTHVAAAAECMAFNRKVLKLIESNKLISVVALAGFWAAPLQRNYEDGWLATDLAGDRRVPSLQESQLEFTNALSATVRSLQEAGKKVVIFGDVPNFDVDPLWIVRTERIPARQILYRLLAGHPLQDSGLASPSSISTDPETRLLLQQAVDGLPGVDMIDLKAGLCPSDGECLYRDGNSLLYSDPQHLSAAGARLALQKTNFSLSKDAPTLEK